MLYKNIEIYDGFYLAHPNLRAIAHWIEGYYREHFGIEPLMTSSLRTHEKSIELYSKVINPTTQKLYEPKDVKISVHELYRGMDLRSRLLTERQNRALVDAINGEWIYDPSRPNIKCAQLHKVGDNAFHLHIQVHPNTVRRTK